TTSSRWATSRRCWWTCAPRACASSTVSFRPTRSTSLSASRAPSSASARARPRPMPLAAPVTTATLPWKLFTGRPYRDNGHWHNGAWRVDPALRGLPGRLLVSDCPQHHVDERREVEGLRHDRRGEVGTRLVGQVGRGLAGHDDHRDARAVETTGDVPAVHAR